MVQGIFKRLKYTVMKLEQGINRYDFEIWLVENKGINLSVLEDEFLLHNNQSRFNLIDGMIDYVCGMLSVPRDKVLSKCRKRELVFCRFVLASLMYQYSSKRLNQKKIASIIGYNDHSLVVYAIHTLDDLYLTDRETKRVVDAVFSHYGISYQSPTTRW